MTKMNLIADTGTYEIWTFRDNLEVLTIICQKHNTWTDWIDKTRERLEQEKRYTLDKDKGLIAMLEHTVKLDPKQVIEVMVRKHVRFGTGFADDGENDGTKFDRNMYVNANELDGFEWDKVLESFRE